MIIVQGSIGNLERLSFIVDTGTFPTVIDSGVTAKLGLHGKPDAVKGFAANGVGERLTLPGLHLGSVDADDLPVISFDLSYLQKALGVHIDALVGPDVLSRAGTFKIDYQSRTLAFGDQPSYGPTALSRPSARMTPVPFENLGIINVQVGYAALRLLMDTRTGQFVLFNSGKALEIGGTRVIAANTSRGDFKHDRVQLPPARVGDTDLGMPIAVVDSSPHSPLIDGVLGPASLKVRSVEFDYNHGLVSWVR